MTVLKKEIQIISNWPLLNWVDMAEYDLVVLPSITRKNQEGILYNAIVKGLPDNYARTSQNCS